MKLKTGTEILATLQPLYSIAVQFQQGVGETINGRTIVKAGTVIGDFMDEYMGEPSLEPVKPEGIVLHDVDTTDGAREVAAVLTGYINTDIVDEDVAATYTDEVKAALPRIGFIANGKGGY